MSKNKGIIGIGLILAIVLGIVVVGGGAYYLGKSKGENKEVKIEENNLSNNQNLQPVNQNQNTPVVDNTQTDCNSNSVPSIKVLSPNGGEIYKAGDKITVKWKSCNIPVGVDIGIDLFNQSKTNPLTNIDHVLVQQTKNDGSEVVSLLPQKNMPAFINGNLFKISMNYVFTGDYTGPMPNGHVPEWANDESDNLFTINSASKTISTTLPQYIGIHSDCGEQSKCWPPVIATFSQSYSCNIGVAPNTEGNYVTAQRVINGRTYCINSLSDGYVGGRGYTYAYTTSNGNGIKIATFGLTYQSCGVWQGDGTSKYLNCQTEQSTFKANLDNIIDSLMFN